MTESKRVIESFSHCCDTLMVEIRKINDIEATDDVKAEKIKRKIEAWFRGYGRFKKIA